MRRFTQFFLCLSFIVLLPTVYGFVPGLISHNYDEGESIDIKVNGITSIKSQVPYSYYHLPYCRPEVIVSHVETLGEILMGETVESSGYKAEMLRPKTCQLLCKMELNDIERAKFKQFIDDEYRVEWLADGLPSVYPHFHRDANDTDWYSLGYPVGWKESSSPSSTKESRYLLNNYISFVFKYKEIQAEKNFINLKKQQLKYQIVGFEVVPMRSDFFNRCYSIFSVSYENPTSSSSGTDGKNWCSTLGLNKSSSDKLTPIEESASLRDMIPSNSVLDLDTVTEIKLLYDIKFQKSDTDYSDRWNTYLLSQRVNYNASSMKIHWFSIINSLVVVLVLSGIVAMILVGTLHKDICRYNELVLNSNEEGEDFGWKLVHGDVFRKPQHSTVLAAIIGSGIQILCMVIITLIIGTIGVGLNPSTGFGRGRLLQIGLFLWSLMGVIGGYTAARFYKLFQSPNWKLTTIRTALMYPGVVFSIFFIINLFLRFSNSSATAPFGTIFLLMIIWLGISTPLIFVGAYFGFKHPQISIPVRVNKIPRQIPAQPWTVHPMFTHVAGGALPFGVVFTELMFVLSSIWQHNTYTLFGLLLLVAIILIITCAEIAITMIYFHLLCEDYNWWWKSFFVPGTSGLFVFAYSLVYLYTRLSLSHATSLILYLGYSLIIAYTFSILTGTIGFIATFLFVKAIYGSIRID